MKFLLYCTFSLRLAFEGVFFILSQEDYLDAFEIFFMLALCFLFYAEVTNKKKIYLSIYLILFTCSSVVDYFIYTILSKDDELYQKWYYVFKNIWYAVFKDIF